MAELNIPYVHGGHALRTRQLGVSWPSATCTSLSTTEDSKIDIKGVAKHSPIPSTIWDLLNCSDDNLLRHDGKTHRVHITNKLSKGFDAE